MRNVFAIIGTTGVGKSKFSIELAKAINGEIINADAMQIYKGIIEDIKVVSTGLSITTNKVTTEEMESIPHHLFDFVNPLEEYIIKDFVADALNKIKDIHSRSKIPIIVGGTHYWIQSLLFQNQTLSSNEIVNQPLLESNTLIPIAKPSLNSYTLSIDPEMETKLKRIFTEYDKESTPSISLITEMHELLSKVDPTTADKWHPNNFRKVFRSLQVYYESGGNPYSHFLQQQAPPSLRFPTMVFWVKSDKTALDLRLDQRVDSMIEKGLIEELKQFRFDLNNRSIPFNPTKGFFQNIGYKEFIPYFDYQDSKQIQLTNCKVCDPISTLNNDDIPNEEVNQSHSDKRQKTTTKTDLSKDPLESIKASCIERIKITTRQYSRSQLKWIRNKLAPCFETMDPTQGSLHILNSTLPTEWEIESLVCIQSAHSFLNNALTPLEPIIKPNPQSHTWELFKCQCCFLETNPKENRVFRGSLEWSVHLSSKKHQRNMEKINKIKEYNK